MQGSGTFSAGVKGQLGRQHFEDHNPQAPQVDVVTVRVLRHHFRRHVVHCTRAGVCVGGGGSLHSPDSLNTAHCTTEHIVHRALVYTVHLAYLAHCGVHTPHTAHNTHCAHTVHYTLCPIFLHISDC